MDPPKEHQLHQLPMLDVWHVAEASIFVLIAAAVSFFMGLRLELSLIISGIRCVLQLTLMGHVLDLVLGAHNPLLVFLMTIMLLLLGAYEIAFNRARKTFHGLFATMFFILLVSNVFIAIIGSGLALKEDPFWTPSKFVPIIGMLLGNSMGSVAMATEQCLDNLSDHTPLLEARLAFGASRFEAARPFAIETIRVSLVPIITQLSVMGLINIPGMMTGQLMAGTAMKDAVIYQQCIMFMIAASSTLSVVLAVLACVLVLFDERHLVRPERIRRNKPIIQKEFFTAVIQGIGTLSQYASRATCRRRRHSRSEIKYEEVELSY